LYLWPSIFWLVGFEFSVNLSKVDKKGDENVEKGKERKGLLVA
jgi:hypothetical protein